MIKFFNFKKKKAANESPQEQNDDAKIETTQTPTLKEPPAKTENEGQKKEILDKMFYKVEIEKNEVQEIEVPQEAEQQENEDPLVKDAETQLDKIEVETQSATEDKTESQKATEQQENATSEKPLHTLRANSLYKSFGKKQVVKGVDFYLNTGEVLGLLGPNGSGKTTSFYMIIGFYKPTRGEVFLDKTRITGLPMYKRAKMGISYLPQEPSVFRKLTVEENIWAILERRRDLTKAQKKAVLEELIDEFSIRKIRRQYAYTLSGGERRRTEIARSLAIDPKFLLLDEPFAGIDPIAVADLKKMISILKNRGIGILITDHNVRDTLEITDRAVIIYNGEIITQGTRDEILRDDKAKKFYLGNDFEM